MIENKQDMDGRIDKLIEDLISVGTFDSAALASILLGCKAALRDGRIADVERLVWLFHDSLTKQKPSRVPSRVPAKN